MIDKCFASAPTYLRADSASWIQSSASVVVVGGAGAIESPPFTTVRGDLEVDSVI
jgi:hypothetical protein